MVLRNCQGPLFLWLGLLLLQPHMETALRHAMDKAVNFFMKEIDRAYYLSSNKNKNLSLLQFYRQIIK